MLLANPPAWVERVLRARSEYLEGVGGEGWLPGKELGSGAYGTVFRTEEPGVVMKLTSDESEAKFVAAALNLGSWPEGITRYYAVVKLPDRTHGHPVYAMWREEAVRTGHLLPARWRRKRDQAARRARDEFQHHLTGYDLATNAIRDACQAAKSRRGFMRAMHAAREVDRRWALREARDVARRLTRYGEWSDLDKYYKAGPKRLAVALAACKVVAEWMAERPVSAAVGNALLFYLRRDIILADVHRNNVGQVRRGRRELTVITDPGHAVFLSNAHLLRRPSRQLELVLVEAA